MEKAHRNSVVEERRRSSNLFLGQEDRNRRRSSVHCPTCVCDAKCGPGRNEGKEINRKDAAKVPPSVLAKELGPPKPDTGKTKHEGHGHHGLSLGALGHRGHHALHGDYNHKKVGQAT